MTGGQGCEDQGTGGSGESGIRNWTVPKHCPGHSDDEYRSEASFYVIVSSPMMVGTDIRLMTPIMKELLLNEEAIAINQDYEAIPGDVHIACSDPSAPPVCSVSLEEQKSHRGKCTAGVTFGCYNNSQKMWVSDGCRGKFTCNGKSGVTCEDAMCDCADDAPPAQEVWVRYLSDGDLAVAMPNWSNETTDITFCLQTLGWTHGETAVARNVWAKKNLGAFSKSFTATVHAHDTLLLRISPESTSQMIAI